MKLLGILLVASMVKHANSADYQKKCVVALVLLGALVALTIILSCLVSDLPISNPPEKLTLDPPHSKVLTLTVFGEEV